MANLRSVHCRCDVTISLPASSAGSDNHGSGRECDVHSDHHAHQPLQRDSNLVLPDRSACIGELQLQSFFFRDSRRADSDDCAVDHHHDGADGFVADS